MSSTPSGESGTSLLDRRLVIVTGKGGTGKTTVAASLALAAARSGRRVLAVEVGRGEEISKLLDPHGSPAGYAGRELVPGVRAMRIDPYAALAEYLGLQLGARGLVERVLRNRGFRQLMAASPGWRDLITLGKIWHLEQMRDGDRPLHDLIVVDAPATGHGLTFLNVPRVVVSAVRTGLLRTHTEAVEALIADPKRTLLLPVAVAEELPVRETLELVGRVRTQLEIALDRIVVNRVTEAPFSSRFEDLDVRLARLPRNLELGRLPPAPVLAACGAHLQARHVLNRAYVEEIARDAQLPLMCLPYVLEGVDGVEALAALGSLLLEPLRADTG